jgi:two-component system sensor histidine kinase KdpD
MDSADEEWLERRALNVIGHELRTPTATVRGLAEVFAAGADPTERPELLEALVRNARRLEALVDDLLTATSVTTALPAGPTDSVKLSEQIEAGWPEDGGLELSGTGTVLARAASVDRIVSAVLDNARVYGLRPLTVTVGHEADLVRTRFESPGPELPPEDVRLALSAFWRGERAVTSAPGLGLGLTVASVLASHEGGRLWVEARSGGGLLTFLELPAA